MKILGYVVLALILICVDGQAQDTLRAVDFGLQPGSHKDAVPLVKRILKKCSGKKNIVIVFDKGRYDFYSAESTPKEYYESNTTLINPRNCAILIEKMNNLTVDCGGSDFIFHGRIQPFTIDSSKRIIIKNVSIDWEIPMGAEGEIIHVTDTTLDLRLDTNQYRYRIENGKLAFAGEGWKAVPGVISWRGPMEFDINTMGVAQGTGDYGCLGDHWEWYTATIPAPGIVRISYPFKRKPAQGNWLVLRLGERDHAGTFIVNSKDVFIENMNMYSNTGLGILAQFSENLTYSNVHCIPNPAKRKFLAGHDDGFHYSNCKGSIMAENCSFKGLMDDSFNAHGTGVSLVEMVNSKTVRCKFMHDMSTGFTWANPGDKVGFIKSEVMNTRATAIVERFRLINPDTFEISFTEALPDFVVRGYSLENLSNTPDVTIRSCYFGSHRARGILVSTPGKVIIEKNIFESSGCAILIPGDANYWFETGAVRDVVIRNNTFKESCLTSMYQFCEAIVSICPEIPKTDTAMPSYHRNIRITGNTFDPFDYPVLYAKSVDGLMFSDNLIRRSQIYKAWHPRKYTLTFEACRNVIIRENQFSGDVLGKNIKLIQTKKTELELDPAQRFLIE